mmetsp:Transcript_14934/g.35629  ORF Transcript_14934/g.35629 Transcript_14934/m.35629 type:complete len:278 (-) Transcript_14934:332-1165(-)
MNSLDLRPDANRRRRASTRHWRVTSSGSRTLSGPSNHRSGSRPILSSGSSSSGPARGYSSCFTRSTSWRSQYDESLSKQQFLMTPAMPLRRIGLGERNCGKISWRTDVGGTSFFLCWSLVTNFRPCSTAVAFMSIAAMCWYGSSELLAALSSSSSRCVFLWVVDSSSSLSFGAILISVGRRNRDSSSVKVGLAGFNFSSTFPSLIAFSTMASSGILLPQNSTAPFSVRVRLANTARDRLILRLQASKASPSVAAGGDVNAISVMRLAAPHATRSLHA